MSDKKEILFNDFNLFVEAMKTTSRIVDSAKITFNESGFSIYGARAKIARCDISSNSAYSNEQLDFSISNMNMLVKVLGSVKEIHENDFTNFHLYLDKPFLRFESKKFKTKLQTQSEDVIRQWISKKIETVLTPAIEFTTTSDLIKKVNSHSYIFSDQEKLRVYLETKSDMENNALFATIGNRATNLSNEMTLKLGLVTQGKVPDGRSLTIDLERLNLLNSMQSNSIKVFLPNEYNMLVGTVRSNGKNDSYVNVVTYLTTIK